MWFVGKRVALARDIDGGPAGRDKGITGTISALFEEFEACFHHITTPGPGKWAKVNCMVHWDDGMHCYQHTLQLEPLIPDSEGLDMTVEELLDSCLPVEA